MLSVLRLDVQSLNQDHNSQDDVFSLSPNQDYSRDDVISMCRSIKTIHKVMSFYCVTPSRLFKRCYFTVSLHQDYSQDVISLCHASIKTIYNVMSFQCVTQSSPFTMWCHFTVSLSQDYLQDDVILLCHSIKTIHMKMSRTSLNFSDEIVILNLLYRQRLINFQQGL